ncbi:flagellar biosynthetic protein FliR [uncultured Rhodospira sp.]|uniref:flagellar biosynthetic protein FliR n=1 Tax=uncultured Rhodospira sp. TaxID=1936189 RepID=UPI00262A3913|nr:flagellar biosynthetic protein FliR [uncultured Rhodospira sp.]
MAEDLFATPLFHVMLIFTRLGFAFMLLPGFGAAYVTPRVRLAFAFPFALVITPLVGPMLPPEPDSGTALVMLLVGEVLIGTFLALVVHLLQAALHLGGTAIGFAGGLMNAQAFDPTSAQHGALVLTFLMMVGLVLMFALNLHHLIIRALVDSYALFPPGVLPPLGDFVSYSTDVLVRSFRVGWQLAAPMVLFSIVYYVSMGIMARLMPQMNVFFVGLPLIIMLGLGLLFLTLPAVMLVYLSYFEEGLNSFISF